MSDPNERDEGREALEKLAAIRHSRHQLDEQELFAVKAARRAGRSWAEIATMLGITRQSAWERWNDLEQDADDPIAATATALTVQAMGSRRRSTIKVPELAGMTFEKASHRLQRLGLGCLPMEVDPVHQDDLPQLIVRVQAPEAGARLSPGSPVRLWLRASGGGGAGVREPRRPRPRSDSGREMRSAEQAS